MLPAVELRGIVKRFANVLANDHASLSVLPGEVHALLGENGAGKSTLMQVLYGSYHADGGEILLDGSPVHFANQRAAIHAGIGMIHQDFMLVRPFTVAENVVLGLDGELQLYEEKRGILDLAGASRRIEELSTHHGLQVDAGARIEHLPVGVQQRVEILKLLYRNARILILDEPTAVLTPQETAKLLETLRSLAAEGRSIIIVTHKLHEIIEVADRVTIMRDGKTVATVAKEDTTEAELARLMVGRDVLLRVRKSPLKRGATLLTTQGLKVNDDRGEEAVSGIDLSVNAGEIVGIAGVDGNGQSQLVEALAGLRPVMGGQISMEGTDITHGTPACRKACGIAYVPADRRGVGSVGTLSIEDNSVLCNLGAFTGKFGVFRDRARSRSHARDLVARFGVKAPDIRFPAGKLSGGNLQKMILGREIMQQPKLLIVEQPTRGLDVGAIEGVWAELLKVRDSGQGILLVSAELEEIRNLADRILVIFEGRFMGELRPEDADDETIGLMMAGRSGKTRTMTHV
ncbi:MAG: ABC transporter ATP-binding protein [Rhodobacteraceae bacterium]|jgi:ABC-type uncharacterized transport system ATPase subunit|nr:ABC transporter ATP-binding protein [Paracoccaceae bacterium]